MRFAPLAIALAMIAAPLGPALAEDRPGLAPSSQWTLDYDTDSCALRRMFGEGDNRVYLEFRRFGPGLRLQAIVASNSMKARNPATFRYRFGADADWRSVAMAPTMNLADGFSGVVFGSSLVVVPEDEQEADPLEQDVYARRMERRAAENARAAQTDTLVMRGAFRREVVLWLGSLEKPIEALNACVDELMTHWGIDVEAHKSLTRAAAPVNLREVPRMMDYPPEMLRRNMPGLVNVRLDIDERGLITDCHIQMPLSDPAFEASSCADIQHALEFDPALDKDGKPIASYWITRVVFQLGL